MLSKVMASLMPLPRLDKYVLIRESTLEAALAVIQNAQCPNSWDKKMHVGGGLGYASTVLLQCTRDTDHSAADR